jgi:hypothetical protein
VITLPTASLSGGNHIFKAYVSNPNSGTDEDLTNDTIQASFSTVINGKVVHLHLQTDCYGDEVSWNLKDNTTNTVLYNGGPYSQDNAGTVVDQDFCLADGCYKFTIDDSFGDGIKGPSFCPTGYYTIKLVSDNTLLAELTTANANFGSTHSDVFCVGPLGLSETNLDWNVFPNPASDKVTIQTTQIGEKTIRMTSILGKIVTEFTSSNQTIEIPLSQLSNGVYVLTLITDKAISQKNIVIE